MTSSLILYGSRARGDETPTSDIDLLLAEDGDGVAIPKTMLGISLHRYSKRWLIREANLGSLFAYHVGREGVALHDEDGFLDTLLKAFKRKPDYTAERRVASLILRLLIEDDWKTNLEARRRFFWAVRTILISVTADQGEPVFASKLLELRSGMPGLASLVERRDTASFLECSVFGRSLIERFPTVGEILAGEPLRTLLTDMGGIARDSVRIIEEDEALELSEFAIYM